MEYEDGYEDVRYLVIHEEGNLESLNDDKEYALEISEGSQSLTSFDAQEKGADEEDYNYVTFKLEENKLTIEESEDYKYELEKTTKEATEKAIAKLVEEKAAEEKREREHEAALVEEEIKSSIESTLDKYFDFFDYAMYSGELDDMSNTVSPSSSFYDTQKAYIESCYEKDIYVDENNTTITNYYKVSDGKYHVSVNEDYTIHKEDGSTKESVYTNVYTMEEFEDGWYITGLNE